jgi:dUTP pyrophosphatase
LLEEIKGSVLSYGEIKKLLKHTKDFPSLIENAINIGIQLQSNGFDLTVWKIHKFSNKAGKIAFDNSERELPETYEIHFDENDWIYLPKGSYKIILNEKINLPKDLMAIGAPRSSLLRTGVSIGTAIWDAGYSGRSECLLLVLNEAGFCIKKNARVVQLVFMKVSKVSRSGKGYDGNYNSEHDFTKQYALIDFDFSDL